MNGLIEKILKQVLKINLMKDYTAHFRYVEGELAVDIWNDAKKNIYHASTTITEMLVIEGALFELLTSGSLKVRSYVVEFEDMFIKIDTPCSTHSEAVNTANQLNEKYDIKCVISEVYI